MTRPSHSTSGGHAYLALKRLAKEDGRPTDELLQLYVLERFLARLAVSDLNKHFVLKGGVLLAAFDSRRPTKDVDFAARDFSNDLDNVRTAMTNVIRIELDDGVEFDATSVTADAIRDDELYSSARVTVNAQLATARTRFHIDVNFGDPIYPEPSQVELPTLLGESLSVLGYPLEMVLAEKLVTALDRGATSARWRDFADVWTLIQRHDVDGAELTNAVTRVAQHRSVTLLPLSQELEGYAEIAQQRWARWRLKIRLHDQVPESFDDVLVLVCAFADRVFEGVARWMTWSAIRRRWE